MHIQRHALSEPDRAAMVKIRELLQSMPQLDLVPDTRPVYDTLIAQTPPAAGVEFDAGSLAGLPGWWCRPVGAPKQAVLLYLHGGGYVVGSPQGYLHFVSHLAASAGLCAFILDYALAPEQPFPRAVEHALTAYQALVDSGFTRIAIAGDSAGGGLTLALVALLCGGGGTRPAAAVALSPWTDLTLSGGSQQSRAAVDAILNRATTARCAAFYLAGADASDPRASPLFSEVRNLPPILIHVGEDEILLDDSLRYAERLQPEGGGHELHVWEGMLHVFPTSLAELEAARAAIQSTGAFLAGHTLSRSEV